MDDWAIIPVQGLRSLSESTANRSEADWTLLKAKVLPIVNKMEQAMPKQVTANNEDEFDDLETAMFNVSVSSTQVVQEETSSSMVVPHRRLRNKRRVEEIVQMRHEEERSVIRRRVMIDAESMVHIEEIEVPEVDWKDISMTDRGDRREWRDDRSRE